MGRNKNRVDLLVVWTKQIEQYDKELPMMAARVRNRKQLIAKAKYGRTYSHQRDYRQGDLVLIFNSCYQEDYSVARKLKYKWLGPYYITSMDLEKSVYKLIELNGVKLDKTFAGWKLKGFIEDLNDEQITPKTGPLHKEEAVEVSEAERSPDEQTPLGVPNKNVDSDGGDRAEEVLPHPLAKYIPPGRDFAVVV